MRPAITPEIADLLDGAPGGAGSPPRPGVATLRRLPARPAGSVEQADLLDATLYVARPPARRARDGEEAVRAASELAPDVVVLDVMMPNKDGVEACREIMESASRREFGLPQYELRRVFREIGRIPVPS